MDVSFFAPLFYAAIQQFRPRARRLQLPYRFIRGRRRVKSQASHGATLF